MNVTYNIGVPSTPNDPSVDQPQMLINTVGVNTILGIDHFSFNNDSGGWHKKVTMPSGTYTLGAPPIPAFSQMILFTALTGSPLSSVLAYTKDGNASPVQLTIGNNPATSTGSIGGGTFTYMNSFLPGGYLFQSGKVSAPSSSNPIVFPVAFTQILSITISIFINGASTARSALITNVSLTQFSFQPEVSMSGSTNNFLFWQAIGLP